MIEKYRTVIKGTRPLMVNRYPLEEAATGKGKAPKPTVFDKEKETEKCLYKNAEGIIYIPAEHIEGAMIHGAAKIRIGAGQGKKTFKKLVAQDVIIMPREIPFKEPKDPSKYIIDLTTGVIPSTGGRVPIARPRWDEWSLEFTIINNNPGDISIETMENILIEAGKEGIGTYRLKYGKFEVEGI